MFSIKTPSDHFSLLHRLILLGRDLSEGKPSILFSIVQLDWGMFMAIDSLLTWSKCLLIQGKEYVSGRNKVEKKKVIMKHEILWGVRPFLRET